MRRITVDEVSAAAAKVEYEIKKEITLDVTNKCGCPIAILALAEGVNSDLIDITEAEQQLGLSMSYVGGFLGGFDEGLDEISTHYSADWHAGNEDGLACRRAFIPDVESASLS